MAIQRAWLATTLWMSIVLIPLPAAELAADEAVKKEFAKLEGTWVEQRPEGATGVPVRLVFASGKLTVMWEGMGSLPAEVKLYPGTDPTCIDIEFKKVRREHYEGVYRIKGDTLRLALAPSDVKERPTSLPDKAEPGREHLGGNFKRQKP